MIFWSARQPAGEHADHFFEIAPGDRCARKQRRAVEGAGKRVQLDGDAGLQQARRVGDALVAQRVELHGRHIGGGQAREILGPGRRGVGGDLADVIGAEVVAPAPTALGRFQSGVSV